MVRSAVALVAALILTAFAPSPATAQQTATTHTVVDGDTLWDLAARFYDDPWEWRRIYEANRDVVEDANWIYPGEVLEIPGIEAEVTDVVVEAPRAEPAAEPETPMSEMRTIFFQDTSVMRAGVVRGDELDYQAVPQDIVYGAPWLLRMGEEPEHVGVLEGHAGGSGRSRTIRSYDRVVLDLDGATPSVGERFQIFRVSRTIEEVGQVARPTGLLTVSNVGPEGVVAVVTHEYDRVAPGDLVGRLPSYDLMAGDYAEPVSDGSEAMIMGFAARTALHNVGYVAFLDLGSDNGVGLGDEFALINDEAGGVSEGRMQVVHVKPGSASARILQMDDEVFRRGVVVRLARKMR